MHQLQGKDVIYRRGSRDGNPTQLVGRLNRNACARVSWFRVELLDWTRPQSSLSLAVIPGLRQGSLSVCRGTPTPMDTQQLPAGSLRIGQRVVRDGRLLVVSSVRLEGAGGGVVSVEFAGEAGRSTFPPGEVLTVVLSAAA